MSYHIWITALIPAYESGIIKGLVSKGYNVSAASGNTITLTFKDAPSAVIAVKVEKNTPLTAQEVYDDIIFIMLEMGAKYYSVVISEYSHQSSWCAGSFLLSGTDTPPISNIDKKLN